MIVACVSSDAVGDIGAAFGLGEATQAGQDHFETPKMDDDSSLTSTPICVNQTKYLDLP
jgi:hypothetical protein